MEYLIVLTLSKLCNGGVQQSTTIRTVTAGPGSTREGLLAWAIDQAGPEMQGACIFYFSAEPNALTATASAEDKQ